MKRRLLFWILIIIFIWLVVSRFADIRKLFEILRTGQPLWILAAIASQITYYLTFSSLYVVSFRASGVKTRLVNITPVVFASLFMNVIAPGAGAALFVDDAARRGESATRAAIGTLMVMVADLGAFSIALLAGLVILFVNGSLHYYEVGAAAILLSATFVMAIILVIGLWRPGTLKRILKGIQRAANGAGGIFHRLTHRKGVAPVLLNDAWVEKTTGEFLGVADLMRENPRSLIPVVLVALACHIVDLVTVYLLFRAFHTEPRFAILLAGYAIGILFWFVSIVPQGIGLVEGMMALTYTSLGIPGEVGTIVSLSFRGLTFWIPLLIGFVLLQRLKSFSAGQRARTDVWNVRIVAILTGAMGFVNLLSGITPALFVRLRVISEVSPVTVNRGSHLTAVLAGFALLLLAGGLWRRKRTAWWAAVFVLAISVFSHLTRSLNYVGEAILGTALLAWLVSLRSHFHARSDPPSIRHGLRVLALAFGFTLLYGTLGFYFFDRLFRQHFNLFDSLRETIIMFTQFYNPGLIPVPYAGFARYFENSIYIVGAVTIGYAIIMLIRPVLVHDLATPEQRQRAEEIVCKYGRSSLARFTLFPDKTYFFSPNGTMFSYVVKGGIALVLGDPIGPVDDFTSSLVAFQDFCARNDWQPAFYQILPDHVQEYREAGYKVLPIGHEAIVDLNTFSLEGPGNKNVRNSYNRIVRLGFTSEILQPPLSSDSIDMLREISDEWLTHMNRTEMRFSLGWFFDDYIRTCPVMMIYDEDGMGQAFASLVTEYTRKEISVDLMRYRPEIENGLMDYLFASLLMWAKAQGYTTFNLGLSALSGIGEQSEDPAIERALHYIYEHINQFYNFKGLHRFKEKFQPAWSPRYLVYSGTVNLPLVVLAIMQADSGRGVFSDLLKGLWRKREKPAKQEVVRP
jgi:phosphatidylglycerol lysyltransferase